MRKLFLILYLLFGSLVLNSQTKIDSTLIQLKTKVESANTDSLKVEALIKLCGYQRKRDYNKVIIYCNQIHRILKKATYDTRVQLAKTYGHSGIYKRRKADYVGALKDYHSAEKIYISMNDTIRLSSIYHNIGFIYRVQKEYNKSIKLFKKAITINKHNKRHKALGNNYSMMSICYKNLHKIDTAFYVINKAIKYFELDNYEEGKQQAISNRASLYSVQKKYNEALLVYLNYLDYVKSINKKRSIIKTLTNIANVYLLLEEYDKALSYANDSIEMAISEDTKQYLHDAYTIRSKIYKAMNKYDLAFKDIVKYTEINVEINSIKKARELRAIEVLHIYEKQRLKDSLSNAQEKKDLQIKSRNSQLKIQLYSSIVLIVSLLVIIVFYFGYKYYKKHHQKELPVNTEKLITDFDIDKEKTEKLRTKTIQHFETREKFTPKQTNPSKLISNYSLETILQDLKEEAFVGDKIESLKNNIKKLNEDFLNRLKTKHPQLTKTDVEVCSFIRIGLTRKEISIVRKTTLEAIKSTRFRLKKKLELSKEDKLDNYIQNL
ncbi:TPR_REGION domain-containing protein [Tenacibaculum sp. 190524A02b]|uniref:tetratricopeptide repeat protein n=1 Tax=Tenacibaculum vairaonense TaxID=3137860 RepID=UPI0032B2525E